MANSLAYKVRTEFTWVPTLEGPGKLATSIDMPIDPPAGVPIPYVILVHGFASHRIGGGTRFVEFGRYLAAAGIACIRFDQSGCGESYGMPDACFSPLSLHQDCQAIFQWAQNDDRLDHDRRCLLGSSFGSYGAMALDRDYGSCGIAFWAPVFHLEPLVRERMAAVGNGHGLHTEDLVGALGDDMISVRGLKIGNPFLEHLDHIKPRDCLMAGKSPILSFHGTADTNVEASHSFQIQMVCEENKRSCEVRTIDDATHDLSEEPWRSTVHHGSVAWIQEQFESCGH